MYEVESGTNVEYFRLQCVHRYGSWKFQMLLPCLLGLNKLFIGLRTLLRKNSVRDVFARASPAFTAITRQGSGFSDDEPHRSIHLKRGLQVIRLHIIIGILPSVQKTQRRAVKNFHRRAINRPTRCKVSVKTTILSASTELYGFSRFRASLSTSSKIATGWLTMWYLAYLINRFFFKIMKLAHYRKTHIDSVRNWNIHVALL
jgi:hypothetical protein